MPTTGTRGALVGLGIGLLTVVFPILIALSLVDTPDSALVAPPAVVVAPAPPPPVHTPPAVIPDVPAINPFKDDELPELRDLLAADAEHPGEIKYRLVQRPNEAVAIATEDILKIGAADPHAQPFMRYLWFPTPTDLTEGELSYALNTAVSHAKFPYKAYQVTPNLYRINLRDLCPGEDETAYKRLHQLWENELPKHNFWFNTIREGEFTVLEKKTVKTTKTINEDKKVTTGHDRWGRPIVVVKKVPKTVTVEEVVEVPVTSDQIVTEFAIHTGLDKTLLLASLTQSSAPVYYGPDFIVRALTTINGGLYYKLVGMPKDVPGKTDLEAFVDLLGGITNEDERKKHASFVAVPISGVTHKPRQVEYFYGTKSRPATAPPLITITHDLRDEDVQGGQLTRKTITRNLLNFKGTAYEAIGSRENGTFIYALYNDKDQLIDSAPDNVAKDSVFPGILQSAISCIRCHGPNDGRQPTPNGIKNLTRGMLDIFDDESSKAAPRATVDLLVGMYKGDLTKPMMDTRNAHVQAVFTMTNGKSVPAISASLGALHVEHLYAPVTPKRALLDLGYYVDTEEDAVRLLARILPPLPPNRYGISPEDPLIGDLRAWNPKEPVYALPQEWNQVLSDALLRVITEEANVRIAHPDANIHGPVNIQPLENKNFIK